MKFDIFKPLAICEQGKQDIQQNEIFPTKGMGTIHDRLFVVCDGEGGEGIGNLASATVATSLSDFIFQNTCPDEPMDEEMVNKAFVETYNNLNKECKPEASVALAMLYFHRHGCFAAHIGNSSIYHIRPKNRTLMYRSCDNIKKMVPKNSVMADPVKAFITDVRHGDYFVLMTKGAASKLHDQKVMEIVCANGSDEDKLARMKKETDACEDNHSLYLIHISGVMNEAFDENLIDNEQQLMAEKLTKESENLSAQKEKKPQKKVVETEDDEATNPIDREALEDQREDKSKKKREIPIVWITAIALVLGAGALLYWGHGKTKHDSNQQTEVKPKENAPKEKDTINVMKGANPKPLELTPEEKAKMEEEKKKAEEEKKKAEEEKKKAEELKKQEEDINNENSTQEPAINNDPATQEPVTSPAIPSVEPEPTAPAPPANNPSGMRPVIPDE